LTAQVPIATAQVGSKTEPAQVGSAQVGQIRVGGWSAVGGFVVVPVLQWTAAEGKGVVVELVGE